MLPLVVLSLGALLYTTSASATAAPAVTPLAVLPRTVSGSDGSPLSGAECSLLQDDSFDSSVSDCLSGFVTQTACQYADNSAWIFDDAEDAELAQECICPAFQDIIDQCLLGCPRLFNTAVAQHYSGICEGRQQQTSTSPATTTAASETQTEAEEETEAASTTPSTGTSTSGSGAAETAQESSQASEEADNAGAKLALPLPLVLVWALCVMLV